ncbi:metal ABC transporter solute-binding protein, Zn/Mn family [Variovorax sp. 22077]|uniref:metal ABC transporter solute-binding protein, Zn/Mn family n=1 Tax=Variovorax sp. 22077 TaxID=3453867 RepID=UPI003F82F817
MRHCFWLLMVSVLLLGQPPAHAGTRGHTVLTALPAVHALASALDEGTSIRVRRLPTDAAAPMEGQAQALSRVEPAVFQQADAVITLSSLWRADALYATARRHNLRIVEIDASRSWDAARPSVAVMRTPINNVPWAGERNGDGSLSPYVWLGPVNAMRMAVSIAADLARLAPADAPRVERNLAALEDRLRQVKARYGARLAQLQHPRVLSLASEFVYLFSEFDVYVDGWFVKQDVDWTGADLAALTRHLREHGIRVVVHRWKPDEKIVHAVEQGGARLLILDAGDPGVLADAARSYETLVAHDMDALLAALARADAETGDGGASPRP